MEYHSFYNVRQCSHDINKAFPFNDGVTMENISEFVSQILYRGKFTELYVGILLDDNSL
jgi:hypothetical protein